MKTKIVIEIETKNMQPVYYDEEDDSENISDQTDKEFHNAIFKFIEETIQEKEKMEQTICEDMDYYGLESVTEDHNSFSDFGEIKITTSQEILDNTTDVKKGGKPNSSQG